MVTRRSLVPSISALVLGVLVAGCSASSGPGGQSGPGGAAPVADQKAQVQLTTAGFQIVDSSKFPEPPEGQVGYIPPEDLTATPKHGGVLRRNGTWIRMDPHFPSAADDGRMVVRMYASGLLDWDLKTNSPVLDLAESWEESSDKLSYTFKLRKGVKFHNVPPVNGRELKAEDVKWSLERLAGVIRIPGQTSFNYARFDGLKEVQIIDDYTVKLVLKQQDNSFMRELMFAYSVILPKEAAIDGAFGEGKTLIGTGPFITELAQVGTGVSRFRRNPDYFNRGPQNKPYLDGFEQHIVNQAALAASFQTKQLDRIVAGWTTVKPFINDPAMQPQIRVYSTRGNIVGISGVSVVHGAKPFDDIRVRRAVHLALDRDEMILLLNDGPQGAYINGYLGGYWQPWFWNEEKLRSLPGWRKEKDQDIAEAKKLLAEAGYANGLNLTCECESVPTAEVLVQQLKRVGIELKLNIVSRDVVRFTSYMKGKQMSATSGGGLHTPDGAITQSYLCDSQKNLSVVCDQAIEKLWREFRVTFDPDKAAKIMDQIQQRMYDIVAFVPTIRGITYHVAHKYVRGWRNAFYDCCAAHGSDHVNVWLDK